MPKVGSPPHPHPAIKQSIENGKKIHVPDPNVKPLIQRAFKLYLEPNHSIASVADEMLKMGITTRKGQPYYKSQVQRILNNPFYIGINRHNGKEYPGAQETFISQEMFNHVQQKMHKCR